VDRALATFLRLVENYPQTAWAKEAEWKIKDLEWKKNYAQYMQAKSAEE